MAHELVTRTYTASIHNQAQVKGDLDASGFAASKLWNVGRWICDRVWSEIGHIPSHAAAYRERRQLVEYGRTLDVESIGGGPADTWG
jgi:hypothetical protein